MVHIIVNTDNGRVVSTLAYAKQEAAQAIADALNATPELKGCYRVQSFGVVTW